jgi:hypothetical protein
MRNCTRDEGRAFEVGNQVLISSHRKLLDQLAYLQPGYASKILASRPIKRLSDETY